MLRVCQFDSGIETGDRRKIQLVTKTRQRVSWVTILSLAHKHFCLILTEEMWLTGEELKGGLGGKKKVGDKNPRKLSLAVKDYVSIQGITECRPK